MESLETRRLRNDYKVLFGLASVDWSSMFSFNSASITHGHGYKLFGKTSRVNIRHQFFCNQVVMFGTIYPSLMFISNRFVLLKRFYRTLTYLHIYVNEAPIRAMRRGAIRIIYLSLYVPCYILSLVGIVLFI